jgi:hypothetical protein
MAPARLDVLMRCKSYPSRNRTGTTQKCPAMLPFLGQQRPLDESRL